MATAAASRSSIAPKTENYSYQHHIPWTPLIIFLIVGLGCLLSGLFAYDNVYFQDTMFGCSGLIAIIIVGACLYRRLVPEETLHNIIVDLMKMRSTDPENDKKHFQRLWKFLFKNTPFTRNENWPSTKNYSAITLTLPRALQEHLFSVPYHGSWKTPDCKLVHMQKTEPPRSDLEKEGCQIPYDGVTFTYQLINNDSNGQQTIDILFQWTDDINKCETVAALKPEFQPLVD